MFLNRKSSLFIVFIYFFTSDFAQAEDAQIRVIDGGTVYINSTSESYSASFVFTCDMGDFNVYSLQIEIPSRLFPRFSLRDGDTVQYTLTSGKEKIFSSTYTSYVLDPDTAFKMSLDEPVTNYSQLLTKDSFQQYLVDNLEVGLVHSK